MTSLISRHPWLVQAGLITLTILPTVGGTIRVTQLASGAEVTEANQRFFDAPVPVLVHIFSALLFLLLGAFQFHPGIRRNHPRWHRRAGRVLVVAGLAAALSAIWMTLLYDLPDHDEGALTVVRLIFGSAMATAIVLAFAAVRRRDFTRHRAWMMRGYAIGMGAGTQGFTLTAVILLEDTPSDMTRAIGHAAGWLINLAVAEWIIRRG